MSGLPDVPVGATWRRVDLHLHTPGVRTFELPPGIDVHDDGNRERVADEYAERLAAAGIDVAAITDFPGVRGRGPARRRGRRRCPGCPECRAYPWRRADYRGRSVLRGILVYEYGA